MRIGLTGYKNRGFNCEWFARIDSRESHCESPVPLSFEQFLGHFSDIFRHFVMVLFFWACVFPVERQSPNGKHIILHKKWGFRRFQKECQKVGFPHFLALFLEPAETPLFVQINVLAVRALTLDRKYTILGCPTICPLQANTSSRSMSCQSEVNYNMPFAPPPPPTQSNTCIKHSGGMGFDVMP